MAQTENPLVRELREVLNRNGCENASNTPDFLLASYLLACLEAGESLIQRRDEWYGIHPAPGWRSADERDDTTHLLANPANAARLTASIERLQRDDTAHKALMLRLEEQKTAIIAAREIMRLVLPDYTDERGLFTPNGDAMKQWLDRYGALADPPAVVEVEEDDDEGDDVPHDSPEAGRSSGRWQPLSGAAHLDFAEDAARHAHEADDA